MNVRSFTLALAFLAIAGCKTLPTDFNADNKSVVSAAPEIANEQIGSGVNRAVAIFAPGSASGPVIRRSSVVNGMKLAIKDFARFGLRVDVVNATNSEQKAFNALSKAESGLVLWHGNLKQQANLNGPTRLSLSGNGSPLSGTTFAFLSDSIDGLAEAASAATEGVGKRALLISAPASNPSDLKRLENILARDKIAVSRLQAPDNQQGLKAFVVSNKKLLQEADVLILAQSNPATGQMLRALASTGINARRSFVVVPQKAVASLKGNPASNGVLFASPVAPRYEIIASRYTSAFGKAPDLSAAFGYDFVAIMAQLSSVGALSQPSQKLVSSSGFRGLTGLFRFKADGRIERRHHVFRLADGKAIKIRDKGARF